MKSNWHVKETELWPVYDFKKYTRQYKGKGFPSANNKVIGFYSSAFFRRIEVGNNNLDINYERSEVKLLELLNKFLINNVDYTLKIYLHPLEKSSDELYERITEHYRQFFGIPKERLLFHPRTEATWTDFKNINTSVSVSSTVSFERLYCGFKSLYAPLCFEKGFFDGTKLEAITIRDSEKFDSFLLRNSELGTEEFFATNNISEYIYY